MFSVPGLFLPFKSWRIQSYFSYRNSEHPIEQQISQVDRLTVIQIKFNIDQYIVVSECEIRNQSIMFGLLPDEVVTDYICFVALIHFVETFVWNLSPLGNWKVTIFPLSNRVDVIYSALGVVRPIGGKYIYKVEIKSIAESVFDRDILPFMEQLGIMDKVSKYRKPFNVTNLEKGTYYLISTLLDTEKFPFTGNRSPFVRDLKVQGFIRVACESFLGK